MKGHHWKAIVLAVAGGAAFYLAMVVLSDIDEVRKASEAFSWVYVIPAICLVVLNYFLRSERWHFFLRKVDLGLPRKQSYRLFLSGLAMSVTPGKVGETLKAVMLKHEKNAPLERGVGVVFVERISDVMGMAVLIAVGSLVLPYGLMSFAIIVTLLSLVLLIIASKRLSEKLVSWLRGNNWSKKIGHLLAAPISDSRQLLTGKNLVEGTVLSTVAWFAECIAFLLILEGCEVQIGMLECVFIYAFSSVIGAVSMLPGGMGTTEATMAGLLVLQGLAASTISFAVILTRVCTLWFAVAVGVIMLITWSRPAKESHE